MTTASFVKGDDSKQGSKGEVTKNEVWKGGEGKSTVYAQKEMTVTEGWQGR